MNKHRVLIVGDSLFAEGITQTLRSSGTVEIVGAASTLQAALPLLKANHLDAMIVVDTGPTCAVVFDPILIRCPDLPIVRLDLNSDQVQVITSRLVDARSSEVLAAIAALPKRR